MSHDSSLQRHLKLTETVKSFPHGSSLQTHYPPWFITTKLISPHDSSLQSSVVPTVHHNNIHYSPCLITTKPATPHGSSLQRLSFTSYSPWFITTKSVFYLLLPMVHHYKLINFTKPIIVLNIKDLVKCSNKVLFCFYVILAFLIKQPFSHHALFFCRKATSP